MVEAESDYLGGETCCSKVIDDNLLPGGGFEQMNRP